MCEIILILPRLSNFLTLNRK